MYQFKQEQTLAIPREELWEFIATPKNLNELTPDDLAFEVITDIPGKMFNGLPMEYRIKLPILGWRRWISEIKHIEEGVRFVDEQILGPYKFWYHIHELKEAPADASRTIMVDSVYYKMPFGLIGAIGHAVLVKKQLKEIFGFRKKKMDELFGEKARQA